MHHYQSNTNNNVSNNDRPANYKIATNYNRQSKIPILMPKNPPITSNTYFNKEMQNPLGMVLDLNLRNSSSKSPLTSRNFSPNNKNNDKELILSHLSSTTRLRSAYPKFCKLTNLNVTKEEDKINITQKKTKPDNTKKPVESNFLFNDYNQKFKNKLEIRNKKVNKLFEEVKVGPYFTHCPSCNRRNLDFYDKLRPETAINLLKLAKENKYK